MYLAKLTTAQAKTVLQNDPIVVIPVGSTEQHGPQCALGTDFMIPSYLADRIADLDNVLVVPAVPYGVCPYHMSFAGSIDLGYEGLYTVLRSIAFSLMQHGARRFLVLNGHGGNNPSIDKMALEVYHAGGICASIDWWSLVGQLDPSLKGGHGDFLETSAMMVVDPESVHLELCQPMNAHDPSENGGGFPGRHGSPAARHQGKRAERLVRSRRPQTLQPENRPACHQTFGLLYPRLCGGVSQIPARPQKIIFPQRQKWFASPLTGTANHFLFEILFVLKLTCRRPSAR